MVETQYKQYLNLLTFATEWRKYKLNIKPLNETEFRNEMQTEQYVRIDCLDPKRKKEVIIYLFDKNSKYIISSQDLKKLLKKNKNPCNIILVTYKPLNTYCRKAIVSFKHLSIVSYRHEIFDLVIPNGPLCYPHRIMSREEVLHLCNHELCCYLINLPKIFEEDPQCIWIGATIGDVVEIKMLSDISGEAIQYRVVVPKSGRIIAIKEAKEEPTDEHEEPTDEHEDHGDQEYTKQKEPVEDIDEEVLEHIEHINNEDDHEDDEEHDEENEEHTEPE